MNDDKKLNKWIETTIQDELGEFLKSVDASGDDIKVVLCNSEGNLFTPRMPFEKRKIKKEQDLFDKIRTIKSHASITDEFNAPISWENGK
ncbi:hypothetical protein FQ186_05535 [Pseudomonas sp. ANT_H14]|uniref:hypothetical protein n=1 Tax=unclassified Pseudomonas TaxID=196821 RepID=UPI0011EFE4BE|nr:MULTISPECIES: hypothetical protein [unclassified Pseudomonas]KAA0946934.1 hypothetical protein FQ182_11310 [Pseudomonas sp. ANT_H4]KAA0953476.1 hypothetical protein FQ186_05535 [Pseudomonas sp. ANT_H14]